jgi:hypothetical protein
MPCLYGMHCMDLCNISILLLDFTLKMRLDDLGLACRKVREYSGVGRMRMCLGKIQLQDS